MITFITDAVRAGVCAFLENNTWAVSALLTSACSDLMPFELVSELTEHGASAPGSALAGDAANVLSARPRAASAAIVVLLKPNLQARRLTTDNQPAAKPPAFSLNSEDLR